MSASLDELRALLVAAIGDLRRALFALRPVDPESLGLFPALEQLVTDFGNQHRLIAFFDVSGPWDRLSPSHELPLLRIIQQGLRNVGQHAQASSVRVSLTVDAAGGVRLSLRDNGRGFDPRLVEWDSQSGHLGLRHMRERIRELGGTLDVHSATGQGTELFITLPPAAKAVGEGAG